MVGSSHPTRRSRALVGALAIVAQALCLTGCPDPIGQFDEFSERLANKPRGPAGDCGLETVQQVDGTFLLALATQLDPVRPVILLAEVSTGSAGMSMTWQPLAVTDRQTPIGDPIDVPPAPIAEDGTFTVQATNVVVGAAADPIMDAVIEAATITLSGFACADFVCGNLAGEIVLPAPITLVAEQSKFAMERVAPGEAYPEPPQINCLGDLAKPVTEL